jgi:hypothetical protein
MGRACSKHGQKLTAYRVSVEKPDGKRPIKGPRRWQKIILKWILKKKKNWVVRNALNLA